MKMYKKGTSVQQISELTDIQQEQIEEWIQSAEKEKL